MAWASPVERAERLWVVATQRRQLWAGVAELKRSRGGVFPETPGEHALCRLVGRHARRYRRYCERHGIEARAIPAE